MNRGPDHSRDSADVVWAAYRAANPDTPPGMLAPRGAGCARCGHETAVMTQVGRVVSKRFTAYDSWTDRGGRTLCAACTWVYTTPSLRTATHRITRSPHSLSELTPQGLHDALSAEIGADAAVVVPLAPGRKHLLPEAQWGRVTVDDLALDFTDADRGRLAAMTRLRAAGFTETALARPAPDHRTLTRTPPETWPEVLTDWDALAPWRSAAPWWHLSMRATR